MAHEAVNADTEEVWHSREVRHRRVPAQILREADAGQGHHGYESQPPHERGEYLKVLGLGDAREDERADEAKKEREGGRGRRGSGGCHGYGNNLSPNLVFVEKLIEHQNVRWTISFLKLK